MKKDISVIFREHLLRNNNHTNTFAVDKLHRYCVQCLWYKRLSKYRVVMLFICGIIFHAVTRSFIFIL